ncbi:MAG TPA: ABC transporter permease [Acidimicrobiia bacterium]|nr:ABC transporter permease [Acidimicrobiia bacterium]
MTSRTLSVRVVPPRMIGGGATKLLERNFLVYRRAWMIIFSGFFEPFFYLFSIGIGLGALVGEVPGPGGVLVPYDVFVAPALLGSAAMNGAILESTFNIFFKLKYGKVYDAVLSTPMRPGDIAVGEITWSLMRGAAYAAAFLVVMSFMGLMQSPWGIMALPVAILIGFAFAAVGMAATTFMNSWQDFDMITLVQLPLFLFSATFYPLEVYPGAFQVLTRFSPLYHGVELIRGFTTGVLDWSMVGHASFLVVMGVIGVAIASRRLERLLLA